MCESTDSRCTTTATARGTRLAGGSSRFLLPIFSLRRQRKVGAAPHRGNANRPIRNQGEAKKSDQGKANAAGIRTNKRRAGNKPIKERPTPQAYGRTSAAQAKKIQPLTPSSKTAKPKPHATRHARRQTTRRPKPPLQRSNHSAHYSKDSKNAAQRPRARLAD